MTVVSHHKIALVISFSLWNTTGFCAHAEMYGLNQVHVPKRFSHSLDVHMSIRV